MNEHADTARAAIRAAGDAADRAGRTFTSADAERAGRIAIGRAVEAKAGMAERPQDAAARARAEEGRNYARGMQEAEARHGAPPSREPLKGSELAEHAKNYGAGLERGRQVSERGAGGREDKAGAEADGLEVSSWLRLMGLQAAKKRLPPSV